MFPYNPDSPYSQFDIASDDSFAYQRQTWSVPGYYSYDDSSETTIMALETQEDAIEVTYRKIHAV